MPARNSLKSGMLMYPDHPQHWLDYGCALLIFLILAVFRLSEKGQICGFRNIFLLNAWKEWPDIWHADVSWEPSEMIRLWSWSVYYPHFGGILTSWDSSNFQFSVYSNNAREEWPATWHADVCWPSTELIRFWSPSVYLPLFDGILVSNLGFPDIFE